MTDKVKMSDLAGREAKELMRLNPVILIPMGSHEDQGPHAPMGDFMLADRIAERAAITATAKGAPTFVAPVIPYGGDDYFRSAVGGIVLEQSTMTSVVKDVLRSLVDNGLTRILIVNGHGGNVNPIFLATRELWRDRQVTVPHFFIWEAAYAFLSQIVGDEQARSRAGHGADPLGSVAQHLFPHLVRFDHIPVRKDMKPDPFLGLPQVNPGQAILNGVRIHLPNEYQDAFHDGVGAGDPRLCDEDTGRKLVDSLTDTIAVLAGMLSAR